MMYARSPGKLILSGEHSVVYGAPAVVASLARYTQLTFTPNPQGTTLDLNLLGLAKKVSYSLADLAQLTQRLDERFARYESGAIAISEVLEEVQELILYALLTEVDEQDYPLLLGSFQASSDLPIGAGMGSSASVIVASIALVDAMLQRKRTIPQRSYLTHYCERLQHGKGSVIDAIAVNYGGIQCLKEGKVHKVDAQLDRHWYWFLQGIPSVSTGEVVANVAHHHGKDNALWTAFSQCSEEFMRVLQAGSDPRALIQQNHALLQKIGVVREKTQQLIDCITKAGGAGKISGAGAHQGVHSGVVLAYLPEDDEHTLERIVQQGEVLRWGEVRVDEKGAYALI